jgi:transglutaminase-like putative cysteine protease
MCEIKTIYNFFKSYVRYVFDPYQVEMISSPYQTLLRRAGDCDDMAVLLAAAGGSIGFPYRFTTICADPQRPDEASHIWTEVQVKGRWIPLDLSVKEAYAGWSAPETYQRKYWAEPAY